eukprot:6065864-Lingulodinium_polyedra.AAC.1
MLSIGRTMRPALNCRYYTSVVRSGLNACERTDRCPKPRRWWTGMGYATLVCLHALGVPIWYALERLVLFTSFRPVPATGDWHWQL